MPLNLYMEHEDFHKWTCSMELRCNKFDAAYVTCSADPTPPQTQ